MLKSSIAIVYLLSVLFQPEPPGLYVVASRDTVMPGQLFTVTVTAFGEVGDVQFDSGGFEVVTDTLGLPTRYVTLRAAGPPRDVRVRGWGGGASSEAVVRICCVKAPDAVDTSRRMYFPAFRA